jgi:hypothetical protein
MTTGVINGTGLINYWTAVDRCIIIENGGKNYQTNDGMTSGQTARLEAKMYFHHKKFMVIMKAGQEIMEAYPEEVKSIVEHQKVPKEGARVETFGAVEDQYRD